MPNKQGTQPAGAANIMDLPIVFADDTKSGGNINYFFNIFNAYLIII